MQEYDFNVDYCPGVRNYIQNALSRSDYRKAPVPRLPAGNKGKTPAPTESSELLLASGVQADEWMDRLKQEYRVRPYFADVLAALGGSDPPENDCRKQRAKPPKRAREFTLGDDGLIRQRATGKLGVPTLLRLAILQEAHDSPVGGHFGAQRTIALEQREFYWKGLAQDVERYVRGCAACHRAKSSNEMPFGLLQPLEIPRRRWQWINVGFITKLPQTTTAPGELPIYGGNDTIITFIDALTKRAHWVATCEKSLTAERFVEIFTNSFFKLHGLPDAIVPDRDPRFTAGFRQHLTKLWGTRTAMSTAFHPQTDGQAEKANDIAERYLRTFAAANERHWDRPLALAEFSYNCHVHKATGMSPFEADTSENPRMPLDVMAAASRRPGGEAIAVSFATKMNDILQQLTDALRVSQAAMVDAANKTRRPHDFQLGDHLLLGYANAAGSGVVGEENGPRLSRALQQRFTGPHRLLQDRGGNAFELNIPDHLCVSRTRNVCEFKRDQVDHSRPQAPPPPVHVTKSGQAEYEVERIVSWREKDGCYLIFNLF